jgi:Iron-containing redox enzyme
MSLREYPFPCRPRLVAGIRPGDTSVFVGDNHEIVANELPRAVLERTLHRFNGETSLAEIVDDEPALSSGAAEELFESLDVAGLIDDAAPVSCRSGSEVILEIEELVEQYCDETIYQNPFWRTCLSARGPGDVPQKLATGMVIENWHFLFRESYFDAPVLSYVSNTAVRLLLNEFFSEEYGHDEILLRSLNFVGLSRDDMRDAIPLPETMGLCNALAYWAHCDPLFFFTTLGLLEGQGMKHDSFIEACERSQLPDDFIEPLRVHANINIGAGHGNLTRSIFQQIPALDAATVARLKRQVRLFVELYDSFYMGVWRYYMSDGPVLRRVSEL